MSFPAIGVDRSVLIKCARIMSFMYVRYTIFFLCRNVNQLSASIFFGFCLFRDYDRLMVQWSQEISKSRKRKKKSYADIDSISFPFQTKQKFHFFLPSRYCCAAVDNLNKESIKIVFVKANQTANLISPTMERTVKIEEEVSIKIYRPQSKVFSISSKDLYLFIFLYWEGALNRTIFCREDFFPLQIESFSNQSVEFRLRI